MNKLLIICDELDSLAEFKNICRDKYDFDSVTSIDQAKQSLVASLPDLVLVSDLLGDGSAVDVLSFLDQLDILIPVVVISENMDRVKVAQLWECGAFEVIEKPVEKKMLLNTLRIATESSGRCSGFEGSDRVLRTADLIGRFNFDYSVLSEVCRTAYAELRFRFASLNGASFDQACESLLLMAEIARLLQADQLSGCLTGLLKRINDGESMSPKDLQRVGEALGLFSRRLESLLLLTNMEIDGQATV